MTPLRKKRIVLTITLVASISILVATFIMNGSEKEDLWLYLTGLVPIFVIVPEIMKKK